MVGRWMNGWKGAKAGLRVAYSNQKIMCNCQKPEQLCKDAWCFNALVLHKKMNNFTKIQNSNTTLSFSVTNI